MDETLRDSGSTAKWPYWLAVASSALALLGLTFAPISGIVYLGLPAIALAAYWATTHDGKARKGLVVSAALFVVGFGLGVTGLIVAGAGVAGDSFLATELGSLLAAMALILMPSLAAIIGLASAVANVRSGQREPEPQTV